MQDVNDAAGRSAQTKLKELEIDAAASLGTAKDILDALKDVRNFLLQDHQVTFLRIDLRDKERHPEEYGLIQSLMDLRMLHLLSAGLSARHEAGRRCEVYMLDLREYTGQRLKVNLGVLDFEKDHLVLKRTRMELQADELCTFTGNKSKTIWLFATIEVSSRLWAGSVLGRRSARNARAVIDGVVRRGRVVGCPLIVTDGFEYYAGAIVGLFGSACVYGQVLKTRRNNRVVRVERRVKIGTASRLKAALLASEESEALNTSFVERLNLTIRQGSAYLRRRSPCRARGADQLHGHIELLRCYYNFIRPHSALRFGRETRTPAVQAVLVSERLVLGDIFTAGGLTLRVLIAIVLHAVAGQPTESDVVELPTRCSPSARQKAA